MTIENSFLRKQVLNQRYIRSLQRNYTNQLKSLLDRVADRIAREPNNERLQAIRNDLIAVIDRDMARFNQGLGAEITAFAVSEAEFVGDVVNANSKVLLQVPDEGAIQRYLELNEMDTPEGSASLRLGETLAQFTDAQKKNITRAIADGILLGENITDVSNRVRQLATGRTRAQTGALVRTLTNFASSQARKAFAIENKNVFDAEEWSAVLDQRTTMICAGRDGQIFPVGQGPYPPAHWNCRSVRIPVLKKEFEAASQKSNREDFDSWLRGQSADFQDEYFSQFPDGKKKAALFRRGDLEIQRFRDETGKEYTLEELRGLYPVAFDRANVEVPTGG